MIEKCLSTMPLHEKHSKMPKKCSLTDHSTGIFTLIDDQTPIIGTHTNFLPLRRFM